MLWEQLLFICTSSFFSQSASNVKWCVSVFSQSLSNVKRCVSGTVNPTFRCDCELIINILRLGKARRCSHILNSKWVFFMKPYAPGHCWLVKVSRCCFFAVCFLLFFFFFFGGGGGGFGEEGVGRCAWCFYTV